MGTPRILFDADTLVISKVTKDATNPALPDTDKIFDSKWLFGLQVLGSGVWYYPASVSYVDFTLPDFGFLPALLLNYKMEPYFSPGGGGREFNYPGSGGVQPLYFTGGRPGKNSKFLNNTTLRLYHGQPRAHQVHWIAISI